MLESVVVVEVRILPFDVLKQDSNAVLIEPFPLEDVVSNKIFVVLNVDIVERIAGIPLKQQDAALILKLLILVPFLQCHRMNSSCSVTFIGFKEIII